MRFNNIHVYDFEIALEKVPFELLENIPLDDKEAVFTQCFGNQYILYQFKNLLEPDEPWGKRLRSNVLLRIGTHHYDDNFSFGCNILNRFFVLLFIKSGKFDTIENYYSFVLKNTFFQEWSRLRSKNIHIMVVKTRNILLLRKCMKSWIEHVLVPRVFQKWRRSTFHQVRKKCHLIELASFFWNWHSYVAKRDNEVLRLKMKFNHKMLPIFFLKWANDYLLRKKNQLQTWKMQLEDQRSENKGQLAEHRKKLAEKERKEDEWLIEREQLLRRIQKLEHSNSQLKNADKNKKIGK